MRGLYSALCFKIWLASKREKNMCSPTTSTVATGKATVLKFNQRKSGWCFFSNDDDAGGGDGDDASTYHRPGRVLRSFNM